ncbi:exodeoxyribonuclease V subunit alpha [Neptunicella marina]|uniref:RecBCD enzyme subunit RecD n=1 Tax=Neptunicella marina TaxID=2125989 RepID=A0A8J6ITX2_9ALTE|nr:exodeoxyribonuclease V subunit alpha [Neptunicella marina]MBC3766174.1 exodeoxyribonuclease V subunit alpha [Neptunicella marina]
MIYASSSQCMKDLAAVEAIDYFTASRLMDELQCTDNALLFHCFIALSFSLRSGSSCIELDKLANQILWLDEGKKGYQFADYAGIEAAFSGLAISETDNASIVKIGNLLYLRRYWLFEQQVADNLRQRMLVSADSEFALSDEQQQRARHTLANLFADSMDAAQPDYQAVAVANALNRPLSVITGGPGTGKTYTLCRLLLSLQAVLGEQINIKLAAPTGKAAQRMKESIAQNLAKLKVNTEVGAHLAIESMTLHRLLGISRDPVSPRYHQDNKIRCDVLVVDEVSMLDLAMLARLLRALPDHCRLILLGDAEQLPSVEVGQLMKDLCPLPHQGYSQTALQQIQQLLPQASWTNQLTQQSESKTDYLTVLDKTHRQLDSDSPYNISALANLVIAGNSRDSWALLTDSVQAQGDMFSSPQLTLNNTAQTVDDESLIRELSQRYYAAIAKAANIEAAFKALNRFRILVPTRVGQSGVEGLNQLIEQQLGYATLGKWYRGRPIMVTENDYTNGLFNGDVGLVWPAQNGQLVAYFETLDGIKNVPLSRLPAIETVYAMTIHKTQGSEFERVALLLPQQNNRVLSKELLYTAITRASEHLYVLADENRWLQAFDNPSQRYSGLSRLLFA